MCAPFNEDEVLIAIRPFAKDSAGGGSCISPTNLRELTYTNEAHDHGGLLHALASLTTQMARGKAPAQLCIWISGAPLTPLQKQKNDVRLIALGETLRRLVSSMLARRNYDAARTHFAPHHLGVATRNGAEAIVHAAREIVR